MSAHVLLVEDSRTTRKILSAMLQGAGYRVSEAAHGAEALECCAADPPDLVLLDLDMPVMDGQTFLARIRASDTLADLPVVVLTAESGAAHVATAFGLGAQDYVRKTCSDEELKARITGVLQRVAHERDLRQRIAHIDRLSAVDELTGLGNRRAFERYTERLAAGGHEHRPVGVVVLDVDHFKRINDTVGHQVGDAVLRILARRLETALGAEHLLVRWGGEEFVVIVPDLDDTGVTELAERLHAVVGANPCAVGAEEQLWVTVSVGCTSGPLGSADQLVRVADEALYEAKRTGRDRVLHRRSVTLGTVPLVTLRPAGAA